MTAFKPLFQWMSPAGDRARLTVLIFHRVLSAPDLLFPDEMHARRFDAVCGWLKSWFNVLPLDAAVAHLKRGTLPAGAACITFDDGYADNHDVALPILIQHGLSATFFIATGFLDGGRMWNDSIIECVRQCSADELKLSTLGLGCHSIRTTEDRKTTIANLIGQIKYLPITERVELTEKLLRLGRVSPPQNLMMTSDEVKAMRQNGMQLGAHTLTHPILARLSDENARLEILGSKHYLEQLLGEPIGLFAYPNGKPAKDYLPRTVELVRESGFDAAVSTQKGVTSAGGDMLQIRRFTPWDKSRVRFGARLLQNLYNN